MRRLLFVLLVLAAIAASLVWLGELGIGPVVITHEDEHKMILLLGDPISVQTEPGLSLKVPLLSDVRIFDARYLYLNSRPQQMQTRDAEQPVIDHYVVWRIREPLRFFSAFPKGLPQAEQQIDRVTRSDVRDIVGQRTLEELVTTAREEIMEQITEQSRAGLAEFGIEVRDVRINRTELPRTTEQNVYARMRSERERLARKHRAEGDEEGRRVRAEADREARVTVAEAEQQATVLRGQGDAQSARIYAESHAASPEFYAFLRRLEAYRKTIGAQTTLVLPPDNDFFRLLSDYQPAPGTPAPRPVPPLGAPEETAPAAGGPGAASGEAGEPEAEGAP